MQIANREPTTAELNARIKDLQESLADLLIERRLERNKVALLEAEIRLLKDIEAGLRRALAGARNAPSRNAPSGKGADQGRGN